MICVAIGIVKVAPHVVAYGCALIFGVVASRALTSVSVARARSAGFEMLWLGPRSAVQARREHTLTIRAELRNRDTLATHFKGLTVTHSPGLSIVVKADHGTIPPGGSLHIELDVTPLRVGYHGIHSLTLSTIRAPGLFTVPLAFSNPYVVEVLPKSVRLNPRGAVGGRNLRLGAQASVGLRRGEALELRELREHQAGDPYRRIAWKASARRGKLMVIDREEETQDIVWILVDLSVDSASGEIGNTALDRACDLCMNLIQNHLKRGDHVGLALVGARTLKLVRPDDGAAHLSELITALTHYSHTADQDRSDWDDADVAKKVLEHARSIDRDFSGLAVRNYDLLVLSAKKVMARAPVSAQNAWSSQPADETLRNYLLSFGIQPPPRGTSDRFQTELQLARLLLEISNKRRTSSLVILVGRPPSFDTPKQLMSALSHAKRRHMEVQFYPVLDLEIKSDRSALEHELKPTMQAKIAEDALHSRQRLAAEDGLAELVELGVRVPSTRKVRHL